MLEHDVGMHQIERPLNARKRIVAAEKANIRHPNFAADESGFGQHGLGYINADNLLTALRQRDSQAPNAAAEVKHTTTLEVRNHAGLNHVPDARDMLLAA